MESSKPEDGTCAGGLRAKAARPKTAVLPVHGGDMHPGRPSPTITTKCHSISNGRYGHYDTAQLRGISLREAAALQSFPDDYVFYPKNQIEPVARMVGNAVPPKLARYFASYLVNSIER